jgi:hypothetical protein
LRPLSQLKSKRCNLMALFEKLLNTGNLRTRIANKSMTIRPGEIIEIDSPEDLGNHISEFKQIDEDQAPDLSTPLAIETYRCFQREKLKSWILNPDFDASGLRNFIYTPSDMLGLKSVLYDKEQEALECKDALGEAYEDWKAECRADPMREKKVSDPQGEANIAKIARAKADVQVVTAEIKELKARIAVLEQEEMEKAEAPAPAKRDSRLGKLVKAKDMSGNYASVDGFEVSYEGGRPFIPELDDMLLRDYMEEAKAQNRLKAKKKAAEIQAAIDKKYGRTVSPQSAA